MVEVARTKASLGFFGDALDPAELTRLLGAEPTHAYRKGDNARAPGRVGSWRLEAQAREPGDLDAQIRELLDGLTTDLSVWRELSTRFRSRVFCGLFMRESNEGLEIDPATLAELGARGLLLSMDIYDASPD